MADSGEVTGDSNLIYFNGIDAITGTYILPPLRPREVASVISGHPLDPDEVRAARARLRSRVPTFGLMPGLKPEKLDQTGWGVIFAKGSDPQVKEALKPLLDHRARRAGQLYQEYDDSTGRAYLPNESKRQFLTRLRVPPDGIVSPDRMPYYLLIVGSPEEIPYSFQYQLDVAYAVGRLHFDTPQEYEAYARNVVALESAITKRERKAVFFGVSNPDDRATAYGVNQLIKPLAEYARQDNSWSVATLLESEAFKTRLARHLGGEETPALLFTSSHGMRFPTGDSRQLAHQGALLCQDWPGPGHWKGPIPTDFYVSGDDLATGTHLNGLVAFHFACYSAGTPMKNDFQKFDAAFPPPPPYSLTDNAPVSFVARLPQRMLNSGALAVIGHVDRAWGYSFAGDDIYGKPQQISQLNSFQAMLSQLMSGVPVGAAVEPFNERYSEGASDLQAAQTEIENGKVYDDWELVTMWTSNYDARNFAVMGDPAVRLNV